MAATDPQAPEPTTHPETETHAGPVGEILPPVLPGRRCSPPPAGLGLSDGRAARWVIAWGGRGRETAIIGAVAGLGLLMAEPLARWLSHHSSALLDRFPDNASGSLLAGLANLLVVAGVSRVAGLRSNPMIAGTIAALILSGAVVLLVTAGSSRLQQFGSPSTIGSHPSHDHRPSREP